MSKMNKQANLGISPTTSALLSSYAKPMGIGAGVGALGLGAVDALGNHEDEQPGDRLPNLLKSMGIGAALGGGVGGMYQSAGPLLGNSSLSEAMAGGKNGNPHYSIGEAAKGLTSHPWIAGTMAGTGTLVGAAKKWGNGAPKEVDLSKIHLNGMRPGGMRLANAAKEFEKTISLPFTGKNGQPTTLSPADIAEKMQKFTKEKTDAFKESAGTISNLGKPTRKTLEDLIRALNSEGKIPVSDQGYNPALGKGLNPGNEKAFALAELLGGKTMGTYMPFHQKVTTALSNAAATPVHAIHKYMHKATNRPGALQNFFGRVSNPYTTPRGTHIRDTHFKNVPTADMPWYTKGRGMHVEGNSGKSVTSRYFTNPEALIQKWVRNQQIPWYYGRLRLGAAPAVGAGVGFGVNALNKSYLQQDARALASQLAKDDPNRLMAIYQQQLAERAASQGK